MKATKVGYLTLLVTLLIGCNNIDIKPATSLPITPINNPIKITPKAFGRALFFFEKLAVDSGKTVEKLRCDYESYSTSKGVDYLLSTHINESKVSFGFSYDLVTNKISQKSILAEDKDLEKLLLKSGLKDMLEQSFDTQLYQTDLVTGKVVTKDVTAQAQNFVSQLLSISNETVDVLIKEANKRAEVLGVVLIEGRQTIALSYAATIAARIKDNSGQSTLSFKTDGYYFIDIETGLILRDESYIKTFLDGKPINKERSLTRFIRFL